MALALWATVSGGAIFAVLVAAATLLMSWEWHRMVRGTGADVFAFASAFVVLVALVMAAAGLFGNAVLVLIVGAGIVASRVRPRGLIGFGVLYIGLPAVALIWMRDSAEGLLAIVLIMGTVWVTDTLAMITGKSIGGPLLWPAISPNKTWAGATGGLIAGAVFATALVVWWVPQAHWWQGTVTGIILSMASQLGDLGESAIKRHCRVKDTSTLIPGHGGVLDRLDGIVGAALVAAAWAVVVAPDAPGAAVLVWARPV